MCRTVWRIHRLGSNAVVSSEIAPREAASTAPKTAVCHNKSRPKISACSSRSSSRSVHASANATNAPTR